MFFFFKIEFWTQKKGMREIQINKLYYIVYEE